MKKKSEIGPKELIIFCIIWVLSWCLCVYVRKLGNENLLPLRDFFIYFPFVFSMFYIIILLCKDLRIVLNTKRKKEVQEQFSALICSVIILLILLWPCVLSIKDVFKGPKEITLFGLEVVEESGYRGRKYYYLKGVTSEDEPMKLNLQLYCQSRQEVEELIKKNIYLKIHYFENSNSVYYVEETEWKWNLYKPNIEIIEEPDIDVKEIL